MAKGPNVMRVEMNEDHLRAMLQPILDEVNSLRARVAELEAEMLYVREFAAVTTECTTETRDLLQTLVADYLNRQDDGK